MDTKILHRLAASATKNPAVKATVKISLERDKIGAEHQVLHDTLAHLDTRRADLLDTAAKSLKASDIETFLAFAAGLRDRADALGELIRTAGAYADEPLFSQTEVIAKAAESIANAIESNLADLIATESRRLRAEGLGSVQFSFADDAAREASRWRNLGNECRTGRGSLANIARQVRNLVESIG